MISDNRMEGLLNKVVQGECLEVMKGIPDNSIDLLVTDPPYGIAFMCRHWDKAVPPVEIWKECLRILKPGAFAFVMCIPRQDCLARMIINLEDAGFEIGFTSMYWAQAQGFPKALNVARAIDKKLGIFKKGDLLPSSRSAGPSPSGCFGEGIQKKYSFQPRSPQAKTLAGSYSGFQPKPAVEVILVAMKPLSEKTYVGQALANGKGITWLDDCRIPYRHEDSIKAKNPHTIGTIGKHGIYGQGRDVLYQLPQGRFPTNLLISDDVLDDGKTRKSSGGKDEATWKARRKLYSGYNPTPQLSGLGGYGDTGSFSRYFSLDSWWNKKLKELPESVQKTFPFLIVPKASKGERDRGLSKGGKIPERYGEMKGTPKHSPNRQNIHKNYHPTCKPLKLISYFVTLGSREGDIVLDPFLGSGTTAIACKMLGRHHIGIERESEYVEISRARLEATETQAQMELVKC